MEKKNAFPWSDYGAGNYRAQLTTGVLYANTSGGWAFYYLAHADEWRKECGTSYDLGEAQREAERAYINYRCGQMEDIKLELEALGATAR